MAEVARVVGAEDLRRLSRDLRAQADGKERMKQLRKELRGVAKPLVPAIRGAINRLPSKGESRRRGRRPLRKEMARAVTLQVRTSGRQAGGAVFMNPKRMPDGKKSLPGYFERIPGKTRLRHPVFGDRENWVQNQNVPAGGYFTRTVRPVERQAVERAQEVIERMAGEIEDG
jgi:hypothetical protein